MAAILDAVGARRARGEAARHTFLTSGDPNVFRTLGFRFLGPEVDTVEAWRWS